MREKLKYYGVLLLFPVFFVLHGINENFGLIETGIVGKLLLEYLLLTIATIIISGLILRDLQKAVLFCFLLLCIYFFFGAAKDFVEEKILKTAVPYRVLLPVLAIAVALSFWLLKQLRLKGRRPMLFVCSLLLVFFIVDAGILAVKLFRMRDKNWEYGDKHNRIYRETKLETSTGMPPIFWIVMDEYTSSASLKRNWGYQNSLDSFLRNKGFYMADSAISNYNYTHYSVSSTLDMIYLPELKNHTEVTLRDLVRGNVSLLENNVVKMLEGIGYQIENYAIYHLNNYPSKGLISFQETPESLIDHQVLFTRVKKDIGWNFPNILKADKKSADSITEYEAAKNIDHKYKVFYNNLIGNIKKNGGSSHSSFYLIHLLIPHEPFIYDSTGNIRSRSADSNKSAYLEQLKYTNSVLREIIDSIFDSYKSRQFVVLIQGDHGFKFEENDPLFESESCKILYAVYNSRQNYKSWYPSVSSVNGFRILFNDLFRANLPLLPDSSFNLFYR